MNKIDDKITELKMFIEEFINIIPKNFNEYNSSFEKKAACERYFEKIIEGCIDLSFILIKKFKFNIPEDDIDSLKIIFENKIITKELFNKLKDAKGMRNLIVHQYGKIDNIIVFDSLDNLIEDVNEFISQIGKWMQ